MAESADALASGASRGNSVEVQVLLSAPKKKLSISDSFFFSYNKTEDLNLKKAAIVRKTIRGMVFSEAGAQAGTERHRLWVAEQPRRHWRLYPVIPTIRKWVTPQGVARFFVTGFEPYFTFRHIFSKKT